MPKIVGCAPFLWGGAGSSSNTMWPGPRPTSIPSDFLIHKTVWPQYTNVTDKQDKRSPKNGFTDPNDVDLLRDVHFGVGVDNSAYLRGQNLKKSVLGASVGIFKPINAINIKTFVLSKPDTASILAKFCTMI